MTSSNRKPKRAIQNAGKSRTGFRFFQSQAVYTSRHLLILRGPSKSQHLHN